MKKILLILLLLPFVVAAQNYLWPTNASQYLSSSFCEYRPGHYHAAIDIKTWNTEGYRIFAVDSGRVEKIRLSPFGYGKVLYLKLHDGRTVVYAHLQRFNKKIEAEIRKLQHQSKRYSVTWKPSNWKVTRGEILGYTGQTGIGVPHLHFEIRDEKQQVLNPLHFYDVIQDHLAPTIQSILISPMNPESRVNGSFDQQEFELTKLKNNVYKIKNPIRAKGNIGLAVRSFDKADKVHNRFAFYKATLQVNGTEIFSMQYDTLNFDYTSQIELDIDFPVYKEIKKRFNKLYIDPFNELPFYKRALGNGLIYLEYDTVSFKIELSDFGGNTSTILGNLLPETDSALKVEAVQRKHDQLFLQLALPRKLQGLQFLSKAPGGNWTDIEYFQILDQQFGGNSQKMYFNIRLHDPKSERLKITTFLPNGLSAEKEINCASLDSSRINLMFTNRGKYFHIKNNADIQAATLLIKGKQNSFPFADKYTLQNDIVIPASKLKADSLHFVVKKQSFILADTTLILHTFEPEKEKVFQFYKNKYILKSFTNSVYDTLLFEASEYFAGDSFVVPVFSDIIEFRRQPQSIKKSFKLSIKSDSLYQNQKQVGMCSVRKNGNLSWRKTEWDSQTNMYSSKVSALGKYILASDTTAPIIKVSQPLAGQMLKNFRQVKLTMDDSLSGIGSDKNIEILIDGMFIVPEWDPEHDQVIGKPDFKLTSGKHTLEITVKDAAGNKTQKTIPFQIQ